MCAAPYDRLAIRAALDGAEGAGTLRKCRFPGMNLREGKPHERMPARPGA